MPSSAGYARLVGVLLSLNEAAETRRGYRDEAERLIRWAFPHEEYD